MKYGMCARLAALALSAMAMSHVSSAGEGLLIGPYDPPWGSAIPTEIISLDYDELLTSNENGTILKNTILGLSAGQRLEIGSGTYTLNGLFNVQLQGTASMPIWVVAKPQADVHIHQEHPGQNIMKIGELTPSAYLVFQGIEFSGGAVGIQFHECSNIWINNCDVHDTGDRGIASPVIGSNCDHLYITRNEIHDLYSAFGEGIYLGNPGPAFQGTPNSVTSQSIVALNHVYNIYGDGTFPTGDGIEIKQGSWGNWIVANEVHDTGNPGILVYGTNGNPRNRVQGNLVYRTDDNGIQVQGEALVSNNLVVDVALNGFQSFNHEGWSTDLVVMHNTIVTSGIGMKLVHWNNKTPNQPVGIGETYLINNAIYSQFDDAVSFSNAPESSVVIGRNVTFGSISGYTPFPNQFIPGTGLIDFENVTWNADGRDAVPAPGSALLGIGDNFFVEQQGVLTDFNGAKRDLVGVTGKPGVRPEVGAFEALSFGCHYGEPLPAPNGQTMEIYLSDRPVLGDSDFEIKLKNGPADVICVLIFGGFPIQVPWKGGAIWAFPYKVPFTFTNSEGEASMPFPLPGDPSIEGLNVYAQWVSDGYPIPPNVAFTDGIRFALEASGTANPVPGGGTGTQQRSSD